MNSLTPDLYWLTLTALMTAVLWAPHVLFLIFKQEGIVGAFMDTKGENNMEPEWGKRSKRAHINAQQNLAVFAALVLTAHIAGVPPAKTAAFSMVYFFARLVHYVVYTLGLPLIRQFSFVVGAIVQVLIALAILQII